MHLELKNGIEFPPEERQLDKILLNIARESEQGQYRDGDLLNFLKTGGGLYSQEDECRGMDDANFGGMEEEREEVIKKYIQTISFLWQDKKADEIELHIEHSFESISSINIQEEIETGRNQSLESASRVTKQLVFDLVNAKNLLKDSEIIEFDTPEEIFFFVLNLLGLEQLAAYLKGSGPRVVNYTMKRGDLDSISLIMSFISNQNSNNSAITALLKEQGLPKEKTPGSLSNLYTVSRDENLDIEDLKKISLKEKET